MSFGLDAINASSPDVAINGVALVTEWLSGSIFIQCAAQPVTNWSGCASDPLTFWTNCYSNPSTTWSDC